MQRSKELSGEVFLGQHAHCDLQETQGSVTPPTAALAGVQGAGTPCASSLH